MLKRFNKDLKMSQCVEREEEGTDRPESPTFSCVSMESDRSKGKPPDFTNEPEPIHTKTKRPAKPTTDDDYWDCRNCDLRNTAEYLRCKLCKVTKSLSTWWDSITALPLSAADKQKSWHKDITQGYRDINVHWLVEAMSTGDPTEDIKDLVTDAQNIERNIYESAKSENTFWVLVNEKSFELWEKRWKREKRQMMKMKSMGYRSTHPLPPGDKVKYRRLMNEKSSELREKSQMRMEKKSGQMEMKSVDQKSTSPLPLGDKGTIPSHFVSGTKRLTHSSSTARVKHGEMEDIPEEKKGSDEERVEGKHRKKVKHNEMKELDEERYKRKLTHGEMKDTSGEKKELDEEMDRRRVKHVTLLDKTQNITPDIIAVENKESYRFHCTQAGLFQCSVVGLVFKMESEGDVTYRTVPWGRRLLSQLGKRAAGPLFDITCLQGSVCQLHFPHCEILSMGGGKSLSVVRVMDDDGIELIKPHMITETHVIINVTGLSLFGIIIEKLFGPSLPSPVQALVSLFYTPPIEDDPSSILKVLLLPGNVVRHEVVDKRREINGEEIYIEVPLCKLIPNQEYTLSTTPQDDSIIVLPIKAEFEIDESSYHNYMPTFVINFEESCRHVRLLLSNSSNTSICAWEGYVKLSAAVLRRQQVQHTLSSPAERLFVVRSSFIDRVSHPTLNGLLDKLIERSVISDAEQEMADGKQMRNDKARFVIDTVRHKGPDASSKMISILCNLDTSLSEDLGLM